MVWSLRTSSWKPSGVVSRFVRKVRTALVAVAVQVVTRRGRQVERIEHVGSAHSDAELALLLAAARERLSPGQDFLDLGDLPVVPARMGEVADWTGAPELPAKPAASGRPASVAAGGRVVGTSADLLWTVLTSAYARLGSTSWAMTGSARWSWHASWSRHPRPTSCGFWTRSARRP